ncbi:hypothetical protein Tco_0471972 [Tanacetum coccineum]
MNSNRMSTSMRRISCPPSLLSISSTVKLVKKLRRNWKGVSKRRNLVLTDSEDEEPEVQGRKSQADPQDSSKQGLVNTSYKQRHMLQGSIDKGRRFVCARIEVNTVVKVILVVLKLNTVIKQASLRSNKIGIPYKEKRRLEQIHLDSLLAQRIAEEEELNEQQKKEMSRPTDPISDFKALVSQNKDLTTKLNALHDLNERFRAENAKVKQHYKELYDSIKITRAKTIDQKNSLLTEIENLKAQLKENSKCVTISDGKPKVLAPGRYPIDVEPIPPRHKNNREVHLYYIKHLKESVETLREIVEEAKVERPLDISLASACRYTKHSQELLEHVIGTCPKDFNPRDKQNASTTLLRKKRVTFEEKVPLAASGVKPRSIQRRIRPFQPKSALKQVEAHSRMNKSNEKQKNHADSTLSDNKRDQWPLTRNTPPKVLPKKQWKPTGRLLPVGRHCPLVRSTALKSDYMLANPQETIAPVVQIVLCYLDSGCSKYMTRDRSRLRNFVKKFIGTVQFRNDHFGAIMGYGYYVIGDSVISRVYYVEGLGHNLFSVGQFCDSDLEVAFRKHTCFV